MEGQGLDSGILIDSTSDYFFTIDIFCSEQDAANEARSKARTGPGSYLKVGLKVEPVLN